MLILVKREKMKGFIFYFVQNSMHGSYGVEQSIKGDVAVP